MIVRIWHGYTTADDADTYEKILFDRVIPDIEAMHIPGFRGIEVLRRPLAHPEIPDPRPHDEVEFITVMHFETLDDVRAFAGEDWEGAHVPDEARAVLKRFDARSAHYDVVREE